MRNTTLRETFLQDSSIAIWIKKACGSPETVVDYLNSIKPFFDYVGIRPDDLLTEWKRVKYDLLKREQFLDEWTEKIEGYIYSKHTENYSPNTRMKQLSVIISFFKHNRIPVDPEKEKHVYIKYHNRDIQPEEIKRILAHSDLRDRTFYLMMLESGLRPLTLVSLQYKHIKRDFESNTVPMMVELPSELLKDRVEARWTFIGEDAFASLKEYLKLRMPLKNDEKIFLHQRKDSRRGDLSPEAFSWKFSRTALKLGIAERTETGKPKQIRLYCLRKYFMNNIRCDTAFREFWMGHKTTQTHYVSRNPERHREEYAKAYENLRIFKSAKEERIREQAERIGHLEESLELARLNIAGLQDAVDSLVSNQQELLDEIWELKGLGKKGDLEGTATFKKKGKAKKP